ncbi:KdsC family phosphatase [Thiohalorhabdus sp. Cl-TMA]|uniref:3-deoxy-D-manno-octulosonate 8-phosphate phosphatase KdsC n=1 Tax=Thiohalorhabdus methylotrophus TaxID=3242694 RepID=A0ABV4TSZ3_9GAMM
MSGLHPLSPTEVDARAAAVELLVLDVDGVLTDGGILMDDDGRELKRFHVRDGHGIKLLQHYGVPVAVITGRTSGVVAKRAEELGIAYVYQGYRRKEPAFQALLEQVNVAAAAVAMVGDDVVDLPIMVQAGLTVTVPNAHSLVRRRAHWCTHSAGGHGAVREVTDRLLRAKGLEERILADYLTPGS